MTKKRRDLQELVRDVMVMVKCPEQVRAPSLADQRNVASMIYLLTTTLTTTNLRNTLEPSSLRDWLTAMATDHHGGDSEIVETIQEPPAVLNKTGEVQAVLTVNTAELVIVQKHATPELEGVHKITESIDELVDVQKAPTGKSGLLLISCEQIIDFAAAAPNSTPAAPISNSGIRLTNESTCESGVNPLLVQYSVFTRLPLWLCGGDGRPFQLASCGADKNLISAFHPEISRSMDQVDWDMTASENGWARTEWKTLERGSWRRMYLTQHPGRIACTVDQLYPRHDKRYREDIGEIYIKAQQTMDNILQDLVAQPLQ
ncbi:hypothetical protein LTR22_013829 [Elasticomyces elasticus]|nr:hypothetical protein LTR22_013829 [Elasticomyces elasticus]KAK4917677.1 hypothetical protein LTR49_014499 [Elasticomyces elasticus]